MSKKTQVEEVTLTFDLHELPTAQHRAGLAGLIFQIDAMGPDGYRRPEKLIPVIQELTETSAKITFTPDSMQGVFDELYSAEPFDQKFSAPKKKKGNDVPWDAVETSTENGKEKKLYVYRNGGVRPLAPCLSRHITGDATAWVELWRRMVWEILRNEQARAPFKQIASGVPSSVGGNMWKSLSKAQKSNPPARIKSEDITGALMLGAQAVNAEGVSFSGRVDHNLLLHFWQLVVLTFVPQVVSKKDGKFERLGYVLAIPDVANLIDFHVEFPAILQELKSKDPKHTPAKARLDLPAQAALEILNKLGEQARKADREAKQQPKDANLATIAKETADHEERSRHRLSSQKRKNQVDSRRTQMALAMSRADSKLRSCVRAVETYHMFKLGNNVKLLAFSRVVDRAGLDDDYRAIVERYRNPLIRAGLMRALIQERAWHWGMIELFTEYPHHFFLEMEGVTPKYLPHFGRDARALFAAHQQEIRGMTPEEMNEDETIKRLGTIVRNLMTNYVNRKAAKKLNLNWDEFPFEEKDGKKRRVPPKEKKDDFGDQQRRVCNDAFLQMRSRHDEEFVTFFAGSILSVSQYFNAKPDDLIFVAQILMKPPSRDPVAKPALNRNDIKTLAMLALSAYSFNVRKRDSKTEGSHS
jgi:hypothetical protein